MAYIDYYKVHYTNDLNQDVKIRILKEDGVPFTPVQEFAAENVLLTRTASNPSIMSPVWGSMLEITFNVDVLDVDPWDEFINSGNRTWKIIATVDDQFFFHGYILPDEGAVPLEDQPISLTITATDGIGLLKNTELSDYNGDPFRGFYNWIEYLAGILKKLDLDLPIRIIDNVYHDSMFTRDSDINLDMWGQGKLEARTFDKDANEQVDCYTALERLMKDSHRLCYQAGEFVVKRLNMFQWVPGGVEYYTRYDPDGTNPQGFIETENHAEVGANSLIYPCNGNQVKTAKPPAKAVKTVFNYKIWDEIPRNVRFERGTITVDTPLLKEYTIDDWEFGDTLPGVSGQINLGPTTAQARRVEVFNAFGVVTETYIRMGTNPGEQIWLRSEGLKVYAGDKISLSLSFKSTDVVAGSIPVARAYILTDSGTPDRISIDPNGIFLSGLQFVEMVYSGSEDSRDWKSGTWNSNVIPQDGTLYLVLEGQSAGGDPVYFKDFSFTYHTYVAGGFLPVKGDYWNRIQAGYSDKSEEEVFLSDAAKDVIKGAIFSDSEFLTTPEWSILGAGGQYHYKELTNISRYNLTRKRFWHIEGDFTGTVYAPQNDQTNYQPLSVFKLYRFVDLPLVAGIPRDFILIPPLEINLFTGIFVGRFQEVKNAGDDGQAAGDSSEFKYIF